MPDGSIVLIGGQQLSAAKNDVWRLTTSGSSVQNPSHTYNSVGTYTVSLQAYRASGYSSTQKAGYITVTVQDTQPPVVTQPGNPAPVLLGVDVVISTTITDNVGVIGANATIGGVNYPMTATDGSFGGTSEPVSVSIPGSALHVGDNIVTIVAKDGAGLLSAPVTVTITVTNVNRAPVFDPVPAKSVNEGITLTFAVSAADADNDPLTYSATALPDGSTFDPATKTFSWTPS